MKKIIIILISLILITGCGVNTEKGYTEINYIELQEKLDNKDDFIFYIGSAECSHCKDYGITLKEIKKNYPEVEVFYLDISKIQQFQHEKLYNKFPFDGTPTTVFIIDGSEESIYNRVEGNQPYDKVVEKFKSNGYIESN